MAEISETRQVGDLEEASVIDAHNEKHTYSNNHQLRRLRILWGRSDRPDNQGRHIVWGSLMKEPMEAILSDGFLRPDACCSSPAFRQRRSW